MLIAERLETIGLKMQEEQSNLREALKERSLMRVSDIEVEGMDRRIYNHCLNKTELRHIVGGSRPTFNKLIDRAVSEGVIAEPILQNRSHLFTRQHCNDLIDFFGLSRYSDKFEPTCILFQNHKGGTGKSTTAITLAEATALDLDTNANVLLIDLDPQGSSSKDLIQTNEDEEDYYLTMADLLCCDYEDGDVANLIDNGVDFSDIVLATPFSTHLPNLDVISAFPSDEKFSDKYMTLPEDSKEVLLSKLANTVMPILKEKYDIIIIDLPPQDSPITWSANEAADCLFIPITPHTYDYASTTNYMLSLSARLKQLPSKGQQIKWAKLMVVNHTPKSLPEKQIVDKLLRAVGSDMFTSHIAHSTAFIAAAEAGRGVLDVAKSEELCPKGQYDLAIDSVKLAYSQFINEIKAVSGK
ncbi:chromosome partitioning protein ParA [Vibrio sp. 10N.286.49.B3]|uniref:ParA family protein n=1 Tax=Vibrio sp. 10N.286.49.B3 TaxID=1880855 RepID=UPI000C82D96E|nr:ParA family protein [Vibrio sp. 10N.286.49.B3]PMH44884.1 chromosome partitioning protein ParA [Vibrio sp. 10N.286.49.B3]